MTPSADEELLAFRPMARDDIPLLRRWLAAPHVAQWWGSADETFEGVAARDGERVGRAHPVQPWVFEIDGQPTGFLQWYRVEDELAWYPGVDVPPGTVAMDLAIGDPDRTGRGLGRRVVLEFVHHVLRAAAPDSPEVWIDPNPRNEAAVRCYRAVGFADTGIELPDPDDPTQVRRLMRLRWAGPTFR